MFVPAGSADGGASQSPATLRARCASRVRPIRATAFISTVQRVAGILLERLPCDGFNLVQNNGACATQVVPHVHFHIVPRHNGQPMNWTPGTYEDPGELAALHRRLTQ